MRARDLVLAVAMCAVAAPPARADEAADRETDVEIARAHFRRGVAHFDHQRYEKAIAEFEAARRVMPSPAFDYNLGKCYERLERWEEAVAAFERFVAARPDDPDAPAKRERIKVLRQRIAEASRDPARPPPPAAGPAEPAPPGADPATPPAPEAGPGPAVEPIAAPAPATDASRRRTLRIAGYSVLAVGVAAVVAGGVLLGQAGAAGREVGQLYASGGAFTDHYRSLEASGHTFDLAGGTLLAVGIAAAATGGALALLGWRDGWRGERRPVVSVALSPTGALVGCTASF